MWKRMIPPSVAVVAGLVTGCADVPWQPPAYQTAIKRYYEAHATEKNGRCRAPYIDGFTKIEVVEDTPEGMLVDARYLYRDWVKDGGATSRSPRASATPGVASRSPEATIACR
jgi:hypothetical protein